MPAVISTEQWIKVEGQERIYNRSSTNNPRDVITLTGGKPSNNNRPCVLTIAANLVEQSGWRENDRVTLYRSPSTGLFRIAKEPAGLHTLVKRYKKSKRVTALAITGVNVCASLLPKQNGLIYDAWVADDKSIVFKPRQKEV